MRYPNIEAERIRMELTEAALADAIGVTEKTIKRWQTAKTEIPASKIVALADLFHVTTDYLLSGTPNTGKGGRKPMKFINIRADGSHR